jgi:hypothetical protein
MPKNSKSKCEEAPRLRLVPLDVAAQREQIEREARREVRGHVIHAMRHLEAGAEVAAGMSAGSCGDSLELFLARIRATLEVIEKVTA